MYSNPKLIIKVLFTAAVILLISNLLLDKFYGSKQSDAAEVSLIEADSVFLQTVRNFGIEDEWISKKGDNYSVKVPADVPSELMILDISHSFNNRNISVSSKEIVKGSKTLMKLHSDDQDVLSVEFIYDKTKRRRISSLSFILLKSERLNEKETAELLELTDHYSIALVPSRKNRSIAAMLSQKGKEFALLLNDDINELEYKLNDKFSDRKLIITIQTITAHFQGAVYFILDDITEIYSPRVNEILMKELDKRKIRYKSLKEFTQIKDIYSPGDFFTLVSTPGDHVFMIDASDFLKYKESLTSLRKRGIKVANLSAMVF
jgi:hypothetical protein